MRKLMTNELASQYSFLGTRNDKRPFKKLKMKDLLLRKYVFMQQRVRQHLIDISIQKIFY